MRALTALFLLTLLAAPGLRAAESATAVFAGGCFWCMESDFEHLDGVQNVVSGFTGGEMKNPTYSGNHDGHYEAVEVTYDPAAITYQALLEHYWRNVDPFDDGGQFCDRGHSYRAAIFATPEQQPLAEASREAAQARLGENRIVTQILPADTFWPVEEYHQNYAEKNPVRYKYYRWSCGRDQRLEAVWGDQ
ncbi:MAG: peptide-methionine (S)-S-oxide reductase MsrA [Halioglobus sp.]